MKSNRERLAHYARVFWIDRELRANRYPNTRTIAEHFEVSAKTAQRTIDFMRDQLRLPLDYSSGHRGWYYTEPAYALPDIKLTEGDLVSILLVKRLVRVYRATVLSRHVEQAFAKVLDAMTDIVSLDLDALVEAYSFEIAPTSDLDVETFRRLGVAAKEHRRVEMTYYTATSGHVTERRVDPLHLRNYLGEWYLIGFDHLRSEVRDFHAGRIRELVITDERFDWPEGFDVTAYLDSGFGMIRGASRLKSR
jgi:predicted DNA-binding transcriptional regulator YafY